MWIRFLTYSLFAAVKANAVIWAGPQPTEAEFLLHRAPEPTAGPDILRRANLPKTVCAFKDGNPAYPVSCRMGYCGYNTHYSWWGCCDGATLSGSQWVLTSCPVLTSCVQYNSISQCGAACFSNTMILKCTNAGLPDCVTSILTDGSLTEFNCATASGHLNFAENTQTSVTTTVSGPANPLYNPSSLSTNKPTSGPANPLYNPSSLSINTPTTSKESTTTTPVVVSPSTSTTTKAAGSSAQRLSTAFAGPAIVAVVVFATAFAFFLAF